MMGFQEQKRNWPAHLKAKPQTSTGSLDHSLLEKATHRTRRFKGEKTAVPLKERAAWALKEGRNDSSQHWRKPRCSKLLFSCELVSRLAQQALPRLLHPTVCCGQSEVSWLLWELKYGCDQGAILIWPSHFLLMSQGAQYIFRIVVLSTQCAHLSVLFTLYLVSCHEILNCLKNL